APRTPPRIPDESQRRATRMAPKRPQRHPNPSVHATRKNASRLPSRYACGSMERSEVQSPRTVGRYVLFGDLTAGGKATVHFGRLSGPVGSSRTVAIKRLHPQHAKDPEFVTMFLDEARLCGRIRHPNVVPTLDVVTTEGEVFLVMEYVAGEALSKLLRNAW